jgi:hypothetical protein
VAALAAWVGWAVSKPNLKLDLNKAASLEAALLCLDMTTLLVDFCTPLV